MTMVYEGWTDARLLQQETLRNYGTVREEDLCREIPNDPGSFIVFLGWLECGGSLCTNQFTQKKLPLTRITPPTPGRNIKETDVNTRMHLAYAMTPRTLCQQGRKQLRAAGGHAVSIVTRLQCTEDRRECDADAEYGEDTLHAAARGGTSCAASTRPHKPHSHHATSHSESCTTLTYWRTLPSSSEDSRCISHFFPGAVGMYSCCSTEGREFSFSELVPFLSPG